MQITILSDAIEILQIVQSIHWKERTPSWMDLIIFGRTPLQNVPWQQWERATACLQFRMVVGVHLVLQHHKRTTSMENLRLVRQMVKVGRGPIRSMSWKVKQPKAAVCILAATTRYKRMFFGNRNSNAAHAYFRSLYHKISQELLKKKKLNLNWVTFPSERKIKTVRHFVVCGSVGFPVAFVRFVNVFTKTSREVDTCYYKCIPVGKSSFSSKFERTYLLEYNNVSIWRPGKTLLRQSLWEFFSLHQV